MMLVSALAPGPAHTLEAHLAGCSTCPPLYASLVATRDALARDPAGQDPNTVIPTELAARIDASGRGWMGRRHPLAT